MKGLLSAYACEPGKGSEPEVGLRTVVAAAQRHDVWVITRQNNLPSLRAHLAHEPLRDRIHGGMPAYGSCAGMIMLADKILDPRSGQETIGGIDMIVRRNAFGRQNESFEAAVDVKGVEGDPVEGVFIRAPWVESVGAETEVLAEHDGVPVLARQGNVLVASFHPELTPDHRLHGLFVDSLVSSVRSDHQEH